VSERAQAGDGARLVLAGAAIGAVRASRARVGAAVVYHRIDDRGEDPARSLVPALATRLFRGEVAFLARRLRPVPASGLLDAVGGRRRGDPIPVAITFDDDLETHARVARPVLVEAGAPATFFLSGGEIPYWWEDLQIAVDRRLVGADALGPVPREAVESALAGEPRAIRAVARRILALGPGEREAVARRLRATVAEGRPRRLAPAEALELARGAFELGFHTRSHEPLTTLSPAELRAALRDGRDAVEAAAGRPVTSLAYPHGLVDAAVASEAAAAGFAVAFTTASRAIRAGDDPHRLPRIDPFAASPGAFALRLARLLVAAARN